MFENPYTFSYFKVLDLLDLTDEEFNENLIEFALSYIRNEQELDEEEDIAWNVLKELSEHNESILLEYINKHRTWGFDEDFKDYLVEKYWGELVENY